MHPSKTTLNIFACLLAFAYIEEVAFKSPCLHMMLSNQRITHAFDVRPTTPRMRAPTATMRDVEVANQEEQSSGFMRGVWSIQVPRYTWAGWVDGI